MARVPFFIVRGAGVVCLLLTFSALGLGQNLVSAASNSTNSTALPDTSMAATTVPASQASVPQLIKFSGGLKDLAGKPITGPVDVTFSLYAQQAGGEPLWYETRTVQADGKGNYTVLLGAMTPTGIPLDLFSSGEAHWLGVQVGNLPEQPRVLLVSVPYAMKAGDAETLGGKPASAYMLAPQSESNSTTSRSTSGSTTTVGSASTSSTTSLTTGTAPLATITGTTNYIPVFTANDGSLGNSVMYQSSGNIGLGTTSPSSLLTVVSSGAPLPVVGGTPTMSKFASPSGIIPWALRQNAPGSGTPTLMWFEDADGPLGAIGAGGSNVFQIGGLAGDALALGANTAMANVYINTLGNVGVGTTDPTLGGKISSRLTIVPRSGVADVLAAGADATHPNFALDVNGTGGSWTLYDYGAGAWRAGISQDAGNVGIGTTTPGYKLDVVGDIHASGVFHGDGSGLTNITATTTAATSLSCTGCVTGSEIASATITGGNVSTSAGIDPTAISGTAATLGANSFTGNQAITGNLAASGTISGNGSGLTSLNAGALSGTVGTSNLPAASRTRAITYLAGCDNCGVLQAGDSQRQIFVNLVGAMTIASVTCYSDAGGPTINIARDNGGPTNLLSSDLVCSTSGATTTSFASSALNLNDQLDFVMVSADGVARRATVIILATLN